jgi:hypothetical protein
VDIHTTQNLDGVAGGIYALQTVAGRGDGYITLDATLATAVPGADTAVMHIRPPSGIDLLHGLLVEVLVPAAGATKAMGAFLASTPTSLSTQPGVEIQASGTGIGLIVTGGGSDGVLGSTGGVGVTAVGGPRATGMLASSSEGGDGLFAQGGATLAGSSGVGGTGGSLLGGESTETDQLPGPGAIAIGGNTAAGDWTGGAILSTDLANGINATGGDSADTASMLPLGGGAFPDVGATGNGIVALGGQGTVVGAYGGAGSFSLGGRGQAAVASVLVFAGAGGIFAGGNDGNGGSGAHGVETLGGEILSGTANVGAFGGHGVFAIGGGADSSTLVTAGHGVFARGGDNDDVTAGQAAGHGVEGVGGAALAPAGLEGNGLVGRVDSLAEGALATASADASGVGVFGEGATLASLSVGASFVGHGVATGIGVAATSQDGALEGFGVFARGSGITGADTQFGAGVFSIADTTNPEAYAFEAAIPVNSPRRGHFHSNPVDDFPATPIDGDLFFSGNGAGMERSAYIGRDTTAAPGWARLIDDRIPWLVRAWGLVTHTVAGDTYNLFENEGVTSFAAGANGDQALVSLDFSYDSTYMITMNPIVAGSNLILLPVVTTQLPAEFEIAAVAVNVSTHTLDKFALAALDFSFFIMTAGRVNAVF